MVTGFLLRSRLRLPFVLSALSFPWTAGVSECVCVCGYVSSGPSFIPFSIIKISPTQITDTLGPEHLHSVPHAVKRKQWIECNIKEWHRIDGVGANDEIRSNTENGKWLWRRRRRRRQTTAVAANNKKILRIYSLRCHTVFTDWMASKVVTVRVSVSHCSESRVSAEESGLSIFPPSLPQFTKSRCCRNVA